MCLLSYFANADADFSSALLILISSPFLLLLLQTDSFERAFAGVVYDHISPHRSSAPLGVEQAESVTIMIAAADARLCFCCVLHTDSFERALVGAGMITYLSSSLIGVCSPARR